MIDEIDSTRFAEPILERDSDGWRCCKAARLGLRARHKVVGTRQCCVVGLRSGEARRRSRVDAGLNTSVERLSSLNAGPPVALPFFEVDPIVVSMIGSTSKGDFGALL